jgi:adenylylsulfate kinase
MPSHETHKRTMAKSITWRIAATVITFVIVIIFTGRMDWAVSLSVLDLVLKFIGYYVHERVWDRVDWGIIIPKMNRSG